MATYSKKQIQPLIAKYGINPETDETFKKIIEMFDNQSPYQIWAIKMVYGGIAPIQVIQTLRNFAAENQTKISKLSKQNLIAYTTKSDIRLLQNEISGIMRLNLINHEIDTFNTDQRNLLRSHVFPNGEPSPNEAFESKSIKDFYEFFKRFAAMSNGRKNNLIRTASVYHSNVADIIRHINNAFKERYAWNKEDLLGYIKTHPDCEGVKVTYDNGNIVILEIPTYKASHAICGDGRTAWCLAREESYFNSYVVKPGNLQYFYFDFSKCEEDCLAHIGFTVSSKDGIVNAHDTKNQDVRCKQRYGSTEMSVHDVLAKAGISQKMFIHLNGCKNFQWGMQPILNFIAANSKNMQVLLNKNGRLVVKIENKKAFADLMGNTLVRPDNLNFDGNFNSIFAIIDTNLTSTDEECMVTMMYNKDEYGTLSINKIMNAYAQDISKQNYLKKVGILQSEYLEDIKIEPSILLHKYIDEDNEADAIALIKSNDPKLDVNYMFNQNAPIFKAMDKNMYGVFEALVNSDKFDANVLDSIGEPLLQSLIYSYVEAAASKQSTEQLVRMINLILNSPSYDFNAQNINFDTAIDVAAGSTETNWILSALVTRPNVNINVVNDYNCAALGEAIRHGNVEGVRMILRRTDVEIRDHDKALANKYGINLSKLMPNENEKIVVDGASTQTEKSSISEQLTEAFAKAFATSK